MWNVLEASAEAFRGHHRFVFAGGEWLKIRQEGPTCVVSDVDSLPFTRLSCNIDGTEPPKGWFWLRWWGENAAFWGEVADFFEVGGEEVVVSEFVTTRAVRLRPSGRTSDEQHQEKGVNQEG
jgi:hypothetical protein